MMNVYLTTILNIINAFAIVILVVITGIYAHYTNKILKEQIINNRKSEIRYKLENVYSPMAAFVLEYLLELRENKLDEYQYAVNFEDFMKRLIEIEKKYMHIIILDIDINLFTKFTLELQKKFDLYDHDSTKIKEPEKDEIHKHVQDLHTHLMRKIVKFSRELEGDNYLK